MKDYLINLVSQSKDDKLKMNIMREYLQVYMLRAIFEKGRFSQLAFVGGTALRFILSLPRFSEDLDFSLVNKDGYDFERILSEVKRAFEDANYTLAVKFSTERTVHSALFKFPELLHLAGLSHRANQNLSIKLDIDTKPPKGGVVKTALVNKYFPITFSHYDLPSLFAGKLHAIFTRQYVKGRDYFDLVWLLSRYRDLEPNLELLNNALEQTGNQLRVTKDTWREKVLERVESVDWQKILEDVEKFTEDPLFLNSMKIEYARALLVS
jgi:predicted nucleotidyltransferase component of viral defense system